MTDKNCPLCGTVISEENPWNTEIGCCLQCSTIVESLRKFAYLLADDLIEKTVRFPAGAYSYTVYAMSVVKMFCKAFTDSDENSEAMYKAITLMLNQRYQEIMVNESLKEQRN